MNTSRGVSCKSCFKSQKQPFCRWLTSSRVCASPCVGYPSSCCLRRCADATRRVDVRPTAYFARSCARRQVSLEAIEVLLVRRADHFSDLVSLRFRLEAHPPNEVRAISHVDERHRHCETMRRLEILQNDALGSSDFDELFVDVVVSTIRPMHRQA